MLIECFFVHVFLKKALHQRNGLLMSKQVDIMHAHWQWAVHVMWARPYHSGCYYCCMNQHDEIQSGQISSGRSECALGLLGGGAKNDSELPAGLRGHPQVLAIPLRVVWLRCWKTRHREASLPLLWEVCKVSLAVLHCMQCDLFTLTVYHCAAMSWALPATSTVCPSAPSQRGSMVVQCLLQLVQCSAVECTVLIMLPAFAPPLTSRCAGHLDPVQLLYGYERVVFSAELLEHAPLQVRPPHLRQRRRHFRGHVSSVTSRYGHEAAVERSCRKVCKQLYCDRLQQNWHIRCYI